MAATLSGFSILSKPDVIKNQPVTKHIKTQKSAICVHLFGVYNLDYESILNTCTSNIYKYNSRNVFAVFCITVLSYQSTTGAWFDSIQVWQAVQIMMITRLLAGGTSQAFRQLALQRNIYYG